MTLTERVTLLERQVAFLIAKAEYDSVKSNIGSILRAQADDAAQKLRAYTEAKAAYEAACAG